MATHFAKAAAAVEPFEDRLIKALENPRYDWRTVSGIASEMGEPESRIKTALDSMKSVVVRATNPDGEPIFTTRRHYQKSHGLTDRLISALTDRVAP
jgi:hypothetical protein